MKKRATNGFKRIITHYILYLCLISLLLVVFLYIMPEVAPKHTSIADRADNIEASYTDSNASNTSGAMEVSAVREDAPQARQSSSTNSKNATDKEYNNQEPNAFYPEIKERGKKKLYLVLDDAGHNMEDVERFLKLPIPLTIAVLPYLPYTDVVVKESARYNKQVILHMPMEALGDADPGEYALTVNLSDAETISRINKVIDSVSTIDGINNHMGSRATADLRIMNIVFQVLEERKLFFLDSRTTKDSVARQAAMKYSVPLLERHVFLDNVKTVEAIQKSLSLSLDMAEKNGMVIMIGHVGTTPLFIVIQEQYASIEAEGFVFSILGEHIEHIQTSKAEG